MKLLWAVSALLLSCWRANAFTGKNFVSAMLIDDGETLPSLQTFKHFDSDSQSEDVKTLVFFTCRMPLLTVSIKEKNEKLRLPTLGKKQSQINTSLRSAFC